ncbi:MAG: metallophosphoesterase [Syntrophales bacterium]|nr:metallophosphoesterase [Syntrophales bacterium]
MGIMKLFIVFYLLIYSLMHLYFYLRLRGAMTLPAWLHVLSICFLILMVLAPIAVRVTEHRGWEAVACIFAYVGYTWMGFLFLFVASGLAVDLLRLVTLPVGWRPSGKFMFFLPFFLGIIAYLYGYYEATDLRVERLVIESPKIPPEAGVIRLVQVSDVHMGLIVREERLRRMVDKVRALNPHLLVSTGDLVDGQMDTLEESIHLWRRVKPIYGKYAVTGNHEYYAGISHALSVSEDAGFKVLRGEAVKPIAGLCLVGVDDPAGKYVGLPTALDIPSRGSDFTILIKHQPSVSIKHAGLFDLQLSGHTHAGQLFPFSLITAVYFKRQEGFYRLEDESMLYISRGTGTWGPPVRICAPPEITLIELKHGKKTEGAHFGK